MGITIHWQGTLKDRASYERLVAETSAYARERNWPVEDIPLENRLLERVIDEEEVDYHGPTSGIIAWPHPECEPVRFEFDHALFIQEYCKTQFAGSSVHVAVVELLRRVARCFADLKVEDEGEYWETNELAVLDGHMDYVRRAIGEILAKDCDARSNVCLPSGRILDVVGGRT